MMPGPFYLSGCDHVKLRAHVPLNVHRFEELKDESPKKAASEKKQIAGGDVSMDADASGVSAADTSKLSKVSHPLHCPSLL